MKFVADVMLGRLARWMRFEGYDVEYDAGFEDETLLRKTRSRILLTQDRALADHAPKNRAYRVTSTGAENQIAEIRRKFPPDPKDHSTRCLLCNRKLRRIRKSKVQHLLPPFVYQRHNEFYFCPSCRRVFWQGTHFEHMLRMID
jgi:hypothetical protein